MRCRTSSAVRVAWPASVCSASDRSSRSARSPSFSSRSRRTSSASVARSVSSAPTSAWRRPASSSQPPRTCMISCASSDHRAISSVTRALVRTGVRRWPPCAPPPRRDRLDPHRPATPREVTPDPGGREIEDRVDPRVGQPGRLVHLVNPLGLFRAEETETAGLGGEHRAADVAHLLPEALQPRARGHQTREVGAEMLGRHLAQITLDGEQRHLFYSPRGRDATVRWIVGVARSGRQARRRPLEMRARTRGARESPRSIGDHEDDTHAARASPARPRRAPAEPRQRVQFSCCG